MLLHDNYKDQPRECYPPSPPPTCISMPPPKLFLDSPPVPLPPAPSNETLIHLDRDHKSGLFHHHTALVVVLFTSIFLFSLFSTAVLLYFHRRCRRRRSLAAFAAAPPFFPSAPAPDLGPDLGPDPGDDPIHHVWYIRTVGLDEATIESIAVTQYRAGSGLLGSADCSVCLGDFEDGDLVRLLPKCGHAFHVPCIDTWLRAHVNCPLCRSHVVDPTVAATSGDSTSANSEVSAGDTVQEMGIESRLSGGVSLGEESRDGEEIEDEREVFDEIPLTDSSSDLIVSTVQAEPEAREPSPNPVRHRSASVDSPFVYPSVVIMIPEIGVGDLVLKESIFGEEQSHKKKERPGNGLKGVSTQMSHTEMVRSLSSSSGSGSGSGSGRAFFFSRNGRSRRSVLPL